MQRCREQGICINKSKLELNAEEITFMGHKLTSRGLEIDPDKVKAIVNMDAPSDVSGILQF